MNKSNFNIKRLSNFIQRQVALNLPPMLIAVGAFFGTLLIGSLFIAYFEPGEVRELKAFYLVAFFMGGYVFTSQIFSELHSPQKSYFYFTLPVSTTEKLAGSWLLSSPVYVLVFSVIIFIVAFMASIVAGDFGFIPDLFDRHYFTSMGVFMVTQTIFFLGASYFRKHNFLKTMFALFLIQIVIGAYGGLLGWTLFGGEGSLQSDDFSGGFKTFVETVIPRIAHIFFWYLLAPFMLVVSYFSLKERQA